jgi:uncharacterized protein
LQSRTILNHYSTYIYLHGFASGPVSLKSVYLRDRFASKNLTLHIPDLNQGDFFHLTLTRQLQQVEALLPANNQPVTLIGSSFGGLTAAWLAQRNLQVERLVLLAPAFEFFDYWQAQLGEAELQTWQQSGAREIYHYAYDRMLPLSYQFVEDLAQYSDAQLQRSLETLILHGRNDEVIPLRASQTFAAQRPWVKLIELVSDHSLNNALAFIWQAIQEFV